MYMMMNVAKDWYTNLYAVDNGVLALVEITKQGHFSEDLILKVSK